MDNALNLFVRSIFSDNMIYDLGHRAAGGAEVHLHNKLKLLHQIIQKFANVPMKWYMTKVNA